MKRLRLSIIAFTLMIMTAFSACGVKAKELSSEEVILKGQEFYQAVDDLDYDFQNLAYSEEYFIINGKGKRIVPSEVVDYSKLITVMEELRPYTYFVLLDSFLEESGYDAPKDMQEAHEFFFTLSDKEKAKVLSCMFKSVGDSTVGKGPSGDIMAEIFILRAFSLIDKKTGAQIPKNDG